MKGLKIFAVLLFVLLALVFGVGAYLSRNLPQIAKESVEVYGPKATGTPVSLGDVRIAYTAGRFELRDLVIGNPPLFKTPHAFKLGELVFHIDIPSVFKEVITINEITVGGVSINAEQIGTNARTNLQQIADYAKRQGKQSASSDKQTKGEKTGETQVKLIVNEFKFVSTEIDLVSEQWGSRKIVIPDLVYQDIGKKEGGLTPDQLTQRLIELVTAQASEAVRQELVNVAREKAKDSLSTKLRGKLESIFNR